MPEAIRAATVMILLVFTSISWLFQFSPNSTSSLKCANSGANSPSAFFPAACTIFPYSVCLRFSIIYKDFTQSLISCFVPRFNNLPSVITASGADGCNSFTVLPNPLPPDVAKSTIFLPLKSWASKNVLIIVGATYHHIGNPRKISS